MLLYFRVLSKLSRVRVCVWIIFNVVTFWFLFNGINIWTWGDQVNTCTNLYKFTVLLWFLFFKLLDLIGPSQDVLALINLHCYILDPVC